MAASYITEFARVCRPGGFVTFQLPSRLVRRNRLSLARKFVVDHLPFGMGSVYRRVRHGTSAVFEMYYTLPEKVVEVAQAAGLREAHREPDQAGGAGSEGFIYIFKKCPREVSL
jgi:hypothetical protein